MSWIDLTASDAPREAPAFPLWEPPPSEAPTLDALCLDAIEAYRAALADAQDGHPWASLPAEELLLRLNAAQRAPGTGAVRPTKAGLLMFGYEHEIARRFPGYALDYRRLDHNGKVIRRIRSNDGLWSGCVFDFWQRVAPLLPRGDGPGEVGAAVREGLANALVHADYAGRRHVVVAQRPDRVEFSNPGRLRVRLGAAFEGGVADPRNPMLMKMFALIGACSDAGEGLPLVRRACERAQGPDPALFEQADPDRTTLTLFLSDGAGHGGERAAPQAAAGGASAAQPLREGASSGWAAPTAGAQARPTMTAATAEAGAPAFHRGLFDADREDAAPPPYAPSEAAHHSAAPRGQLGEDEAAVAAAMARARDGDCQAALELFRTSRRLRRADVEEVLGVGSTKAKAIVAALVSDGIVDAEGSGRSTYYKLARA